MTKKFGCPQQEAYNLLETARKIGLTVNGVSFHVGSGCRDPHAYSRVLKEAKRTFQDGAALGYDMNILDIGGGFSGETTNNYGVLDFDVVADVINRSLDEYFPEEDNKEASVQIIAEPGAYFALPSTYLVTNIIGTRDNTVKHGFGLQQDGPKIEYFINDGNQSSLFLCNVAPGLIPVVKPVSEDYLDMPTFKCKIWGQTCDEDVVMEACRLPKMKTGDWLYFTDVGSYSSVYCTNFNGFTERPIYRYISKTMLNCFDELSNEGVFLQLPDQLGYPMEDRTTSFISDM